MSNLVVGEWYYDDTPGHEGQPLVGHRLRLLQVKDATVVVVDEHSNHREVNRALWERDMKPEK